MIVGPAMIRMMKKINAVDENLNIELTPFSFSGVMPTMADGVGGREGSSGGKN